MTTQTTNTRTMTTRIIATAAGVATAIAATLAPAAHAQLFITEVFENPDGSDAPLEFIEIYGRPGMSLDGYAIGLFKGGTDENDDDIPDGTGSDDIPEIDEAYQLDGFTIGDNGFAILYNDTDNNSLIPGNIPPETTLIPFTVAHIPTTDTAGSLNDEGSSTYILVRTRQSPQNFRKEILPDLDFDGKVDFGTEAPPFFGGATPRAIQPFQRIDEIAWSNNGGKEYVADSEREIADTPGFNPDFIARVEYYFENPNRGHRSRPDGMGGFEIVSTRIADESFVYGEVSSGVTADTSTDTDGLPQTKGPTDQNATPYDGSCDPEPFNPGPNPACTPNPNGSFLFTDENLDGFLVTPGDYNDGAALFQIRLAAAQSGNDLPTGFTGRVWQDGDLNFDFSLDAADLTIAQSLLGATLDDTTPDTDPAGQPTTRWAYQLTSFQTLEMARNLDQTDGSAGANADAVTQADIDALAALLPCTADTNNDQTVGLDDLLTVLANFGNTTTNGPTDGDVDPAGAPDGTVGLNDLLLILANFGNTCT